MRNLLLGLSLFLPSALFSQVLAGPLDQKIYGVSLGSWLVLEPWMLPQEWTDMGGQICDFSNCIACIMTESAFARKYGPTVTDEKFAKHWDTWFNQTSVDEIKDAGINTVRLPLGYWIVEALVDRTKEAYPRGGLFYLRRGLKWLKDAGLQVILDHHALPGVQTPGQMFTGDCTSDVQFYTPYNYHRALVWTAVMASLSHLDPNFGSVFAIEAVNEPMSNASMTPGYGEFQKNFVQTIRAVESILGIEDPDTPTKWDVPLSSQTNFTAALGDACSSSPSSFDPEVVKAIQDAIPILLDIAFDPLCAEELAGIFTSQSFRSDRSSLFTNFMDVNWQNPGPDRANPVDAADGPQGYDSHLYYFFGGVAAPNENAYLTSICNLQRIQNDAALGNTPLWFGEWGVGTEFTATDEFLKKWGDAQKWAYGQSAGWIYWNFRTEISAMTNGTELARLWSYLTAVEMGLLTKDPWDYYDPNVCEPYIQKA